MANETFTANQSTVFALDTDGDGVIDPGEIVTTTVTITNNSTTPTPVNATGVQFTEDLQGMTLVNQAGDDINASPIAFDDSYTAAGNVAFGATISLLINDTEPLGPEGLALNTGTAIQNTGVAFATTQGGSVTLNANGTFTYISAVGFEGVDTFTYTLRDTGLDAVAGNADDLTDTGTVSITVGPSVWFIDNNAAPGGNGTQASPFNSIAAFNAAQGTANGPDAGDFIYLRQGTGTYSEADGINLANGQTLIGAGQDLVVNGVTIETHTAAPTIQVTGANNEGVQLAQDNTLKGFNISTTVASADGIEDGGGSVGNLTISNVSISGTGQAVDIDQGGNLNVTLDSLSSTGSGEQGVQLAAGGAALTGTFTAGGGSISGSGGAAFLVGDGAGGANTGGTITVTYTGSISSTGAVRTVDIEDRSAGAGAVTLSGNLSHSGNGTAVFLDDNAAGTITFAGATKTLSGGTATAVSLTDNTGATINFTAGGLDIDTTSGAGFLATGGGTVTVQGSNNSITSTTGTALNVANTNIGASGLTFHDISANGATNGIILNTTGASGGLTVTGTGTTAGSGGTIQNNVQGALFTSTSNLSLSNMNFTNPNSGNGTVNNIDSSSFNSAAQAGINMSSVSGATFTNLNINGNGGAGGAQAGISGQNVSNLAIANSTVTGFGDASNESVVMLWNLTGTSSITNSTFGLVPGDTTGGTNLIDIRGNTGTLTLNVTGSTFQNTRDSVNGSAGLIVTAVSNQTVNLNVSNSDFLNLKTSGIETIARDTSTMNVNITDGGVTGNGNNFDPGSTGGVLNTGRAIGLNAEDTAHLNFNINRNEKIYGQGGPIINVFGINNAVINGRIDNNNAANNATSGIMGGGFGNAASPGSGINIHPEDNAQAT